MIGAAKAAIRTGMAGIVPLSLDHQRFVCIQTDTGGRQLRLEQMAAGFRRFEVVVGEMPTLTGEQMRTCRFEAGLLIRVRYERTEDFDLFETLIYEDITTIIQMVRDAANWDQANSGLTGVRADGAIIENVPDDDTPIAVIVAIPLKIYIRRLNHG